MTMIQDSQLHRHQETCVCCGNPIVDNAYGTLCEGNQEEVGTVCENCVDEVVRCDCCHTLHRLDDTEEYTPAYWRRYHGAGLSGHVCDWCAENSDEYIRCADCDSLVHRDDAITVGRIASPRSYQICQSCYDDQYETCAVCGTVHLRDELIYDDDREEYVCHECDVYRNCMHDYYYKPCPIFFYGKNQGVSNYWSLPAQYQYTDTSGIELEIDDPNMQGISTKDYEECMKELCALATEYGWKNRPLFYLKHDGSLSSHGIEIVSEPCTFDFYMNGFPFEQIHDIAVKHGYRSHESRRSCGLHVHLSRMAFGTDDDEQNANILKSTMLVDKFWDEMVRFSRRNRDDLFQWAARPGVSIKPYDDEDEIHDKFYCYQMDTGDASICEEIDHSERYHAINLQNACTVEFRLFRGTLKVSTIKATLQFLHNLVTFCRKHDIIASNFADWEELMGVQHFDELNEYLVARGIEHPLHDYSKLYKQALDDSKKPGFNCYECDTAMDMTMEDENRAQVNWRPSADNDGERADGIGNDPVVCAAALDTEDVRQVVESGLNNFQYELSYEDLARAIDDAAYSTPDTERATLSPAV